MAMRQVNQPAGMHILGEVAGHISEQEKKGEPT
jgi:hypothetical protein